MSTFHLDFMLGDDSLDGTSWANAWKTLTAGPTAARCAPGDTILIAKTPDEVSLSTNVAMTWGSGSCTLSAAKTLNVDLCEAAWTSDGGADVECDTTGYINKGTNCVRNKVKAAFTTGLAAHHATAATLDCSSYQKLSFCLRTDVQIAANSLRFDLCSDTAGTTAVDSFTITHVLLAARVYMLTINKGSALGSSIRSIAMVVLSDLGSSDVTIKLDNFLAANSLHLQSIIGRTGGQWMAIQGIDGTDISLGMRSYAGGFSEAKWAAASDTFAAYVRECAAVESVGNTGDLITQEAGTVTAPYLYKGGINRADDEQDGHTFLMPLSTTDSYSGYNYGIYANPFCEFENISGAGWQYIFSIMADANALRFKNLNMVSCNQAFNPNNYFCYGMKFEGTWKWTPMENMVNMTGLSTPSAGQGLMSDADLYIWSKYAWGTKAVFQGSDILWTGKIVIDNAGRSDQQDNGIDFNLSGSSYINEVEITGSQNAALFIRGGELEIGKLTIGAACLKVFYFSGTVGASRVRIGNYVLSGGAPTEVEWLTPTTYSVTGYMDSISFDRYKAENRYKQLSRCGIISDHITGGQAAAWAYGGSGLSLLLNPSSRRYPLIHSFWIPVDTTVNQKLHMQVIKDSAGADCTMTATIQGCGVDLPLASVTLTDSWAEYQSAAFTPTHKGFLKVILLALDGATTGDIGIDDIHIGA